MDDPTMLAAEPEGHHIARRGRPSKAQKAAVQIQGDEEKTNIDYLFGRYEYYQISRLA